LAKEDHEDLRNLYVVPETRPLGVKMVEKEEIVANNNASLEEWKQGYREGFKNGFEEGKRCEAAPIYPWKSRFEPLGNPPIPPGGGWIPPINYPRSCGVCGLDLSLMTGYVCPRMDCPGRISCGTININTKGATMIRDPGSE
jgi:hypothetical protein